jgi:hypothetical protein
VNPAYKIGEITSGSFMTLNPIPVQNYKSRMQASGSKLPRWHFEPMSLFQNDANNHEEYFNADDDNPVARALREIFQNIGDAGASLLLLRFRHVSVEALDAIDFEEIVDRAGGMTVSEERLPLKASVTNGRIRCLEVTDNGTGLTGEYRSACRATQRPSGYQSFNSGFGNSSKAGSNASGSKGLGRSMIVHASAIRTAAVYTRRSDGVELGFGLSLLGFNSYDGKEYRGTGQYLIDHTADEIPSVPPLVGQDASEFKEVLGMNSKGFDTGLSLLLTSVAEEYTVDTLVATILTNHVYPIVSDRLEVIVGEEDDEIVINSATILKLAADERFGGGEAMVAKIQAFSLALGAMKVARDIGSPVRIARESFPDELIEILAGEFEQGVPVAVRAVFQPRERGDRKEGTIVISALRDARLAVGCTVHIRDGISVFSPGPAGTVVIVQSENDGVAQLLRDAEDPTHTKWEAKRAVSWPANKTHDIVQSFKKGGEIFINALLRVREDKDSNGFSGLFSMPAETADRAIANKGPETPERPDIDFAPMPELPPALENPDLFLVEGLLPDDTERYPGFKISLTEAGRALVSAGEMPEKVVFTAAYAVTAGKPKWDKHSAEDFDLDDFKITRMGAKGADVLTPNTLGIRGPIREDFEVVGRGRFSTMRGVSFRYTNAAA